MDTKPWGSYTAADYTIEQWHAACLIHQHDGPPQAKSDCKLPIKTPSGAVNKNAIFAAAAALSGARTPINASADEKKKAARTLIRYYKELDKTPPESLLTLSHTDISDTTLEHFGVKGMKWGVRKDRSSKSTGEAPKRTSRKKKIAIGVGAGMLATGAVAAGIVLKKYGNTSYVHIMQQSEPMVKVMTRPASAATRSASSTRKTGASAVKKLADTDTFTKLLKELDADMARAHQEQTSWMLKNVPGYNPRQNPYVPKTELKRLSNR
jgi:hypothetical protein